MRIETIMTAVAAVAAVARRWIAASGALAIVATRNVSAAVYVKTTIAVFVVFLALPASPTKAEAARPPHPTTNPASPVMLSGAWLPKDSHQLDFTALPRVPSKHVVISDVRAKGQYKQNHKKGGVNQHNYLAFHDGRFWAMWSDGPGIEDRVGQVVKYATSANGLKWSEPQFLTPYPPNSGPNSPHYNTRTNKGMRWISRGFWKREGELLAIASLDEAAGFFGPSLELRAFRFNKPRTAWEDVGLIYKNAINNFPPKKLRTGDWLMSRRPHNYSKTGVHFLVGGVKAIDDWKSYPVLGSASDLTAEEPGWWILPDKSLSAIFRDNRRSGYLYRAFSTDDGRTWSKPVKTNYPDATSKMRGVRLSDGRYVLVSNSNPKARNPLTLAISRDGLVFTKLMVVVDAQKLGYAWIDYPDVMEHEGSLFIAFAGSKGSVNVLKVRLTDVDAVKMSSSPLLASEKTKRAVHGADKEPAFFSLFDGKTFTGWKHGGNWVIEDGAFFRKKGGGSLTYTKALVPDNFELRFEWKVSKGCNSGVYYRPAQYEYQILDNIHSPYGENPRQAAGSLFFCMAPSKDVTKPFGQWNSGRVKCKGTVIEHWVNGERVLSFDYTEPKWAKQVELLKIRGADLNARGGRLWLQDHGQDVWFRKLRWREIPASEKLAADPKFVPLPVTGEALKKEQARVKRMLEAQEKKP